MKKRLDFLDYAKCFAIIFVVMEHAGVTPVAPFACIFPVFFVVAGYTYENSSKSLKEIGMSCFKKTMIPFWMALIVYGLFEVFRANYMGYGDVKLLGSVFANAVYGSSLIPNPNGVLDFLKETTTPWAPQSYNIQIIYPTTCHLWFLPSFFTSKIIFSFIMKKVKKIGFGYFFIMICFITLASLESILIAYGQFPYGLGRGFLFTSFMMLGYFLKKLRLIENNSRHVILSSLFVGLTLLIASRLLGNGHIAWIISNYGQHGVWGAFIVFILGTGGSLCILYLCLFIEKTFAKTPKFILSQIGRNTMSIYLWHMIFLTFIDLLYGTIFNKPFSPDQYLVNLFTNEMLLYNIVKGVLALTLCMISVSIFKRIKCAQNKH